MALAAPIASVVGGIGGALIGRSGQNRALQSQERATMAQIQLERDRDAARNARFEAANRRYDQEMANYNQIRRQLLGHYGINLGDQGGGAAPAGAQGVKGGMSLGDLVSRGDGMAPMGGAPAAAPALGPAEEAMGGGGDVFDWRNYGVAR